MGAQVGIFGNAQEFYGVAPVFSGLTLLNSGRNLKTTWNFTDFIGAWYPWDGVWYDARVGAADSYPMAAGDAGRVGILGHVVTGAGDAVGSTAMTLNNLGWGILFGAATYTFETEMALATGLSTAAQEYELYFGFGDAQAAGNFTDGVYFRYDRVVLGANWWACSARAGVRTAVDTGIPADLVYHKFKIVVNAAGTSAAFYVDGALVATIITNIPVAPDVTGAVLKCAKTVGAGARWFFYDWVWLHVDLVVSR
jgi:hypothetical protein